MKQLILLIWMLIVFSAVYAQEQLTGQLKMQAQNTLSNSTVYMDLVFDKGK